MVITRVVLTQCTHSCSHWWQEYSRHSPSGCGTWSFQRFPHPHWRSDLSLLGHSPVDTQIRIRSSWGKSCGGTLDIFLNFFLYQCIPSAPTHLDPEQGIVVLGIHTLHVLQFNGLGQHHLIKWPDEEGWRGDNACVLLMPVFCVFALLFVYCWNWQLFPMSRLPCIIHTIRLIV